MIHDISGPGRIIMGFDDIWQPLQEGQFFSDGNVLHDCFNDMFSVVHIN